MLEVEEEDVILPLVLVELVEPVEVEPVEKGLLRLLTVRTIWVVVEEEGQIQAWLALAAPE